MCYPKKRSILNRKAESPTARLGRRRVWPVLCVMVFTLLFSKDYSVAADNYKQSYKQYAWIYLDYDIDEFDCLDKLYTAESQWNPKARNGSHYGIPQGRSKWLITANHRAGRSILLLLTLMHRLGGVSSTMSIGMAVCVQPMSIGY